MSNRYPGKCSRCGGHVAAEAGVVEKKEGSWVTRHAGRKCPEASEQPAVPARPREDDAKGDETVLAGKVTRDGKAYYMVARTVRGRTWRDDRAEAITTRDGQRMLLCFRDGSKTFWADCAAIQITHRYQQPKTIGSLRHYAERAKAAAANSRYGDAGWMHNGCAECRRLQDWCPSCAFDEFDN